MHQFGGTFPLMFIGRSFFVGVEPTKGWGPFKVYDRKRANDIAVKAVQSFGITRIDDGDRLVGGLSGGERQALAIARAVHFGARVLILDEPTAALGVKQASHVLRIVNEAKKRGLAVIFITHQVMHAVAVGLWNWPAHDLMALKRTGATFTIMNGYLEGRLADDAGADMLLASAAQTLQVGKRFGVHRLNLHGTGLGDGGIPIWRTQVVTGAMWLKARDTLHRICDLAEAGGVVFTLENLNLRDHPGCPFNSTADVLALVSAVNRPQLRINLDLYHTQIGEGDLIRWCEACLPWIGEVQVADNPGRFEPGIGEINYSGVAKALQALGYSGPVGMEAFASADPEAALSAFRAAFTV